MASLRLWAAHRRALSPVACGVNERTRGVRTTLTTATSDVCSPVRQSVRSPEEVARKQRAVCAVEALDALACSAAALPFAAAPAQAVTGRLPLARFTLPPHEALALATVAPALPTAAITHTRGPPSRCHGLSSPATNALHPKTTRKRGASPTSRGSCSGLRSARARQRPPWLRAPIVPHPVSALPMPSPAEWGEVTPHLFPGIWAPSDCGSSCAGRRTVARTRTCAARGPRMTYDTPRAADPSRR